MNSKDRTKCGGTKTRVLQKLPRLDKGLSMLSGSVGKGTRMYRIMGCLVSGGVCRGGLRCDGVCMCVSVGALKCLNIIQYSHNIKTPVSICMYLG